MNDQIDETKHRLFLSAVIEMWDRKMDTDQIAHALDRPQHEIERALHLAMWMRRNEHDLSPP